MVRATAVLLLVYACKAAPSGGDAPDAGLPCVDPWLAEHHLNEYGDPAGTMYAGGSPLFDEKTGTRKSRLQVLLAKQPELAHACPREMAGAFQ
jgi:hypothetical protein